jgi:hypothetical protein
MGLSGLPERRAGRGRARLGYTRPRARGLSSREVALDHETASPQIADLAAGRLGRERAESVRAHVATCEECRGALAGAEALRAEAEAGGAALFTPHPESDELACYAVNPEELTTPALAALGAHARACPTCAREVATARAARATAWRRTLPGWLARPGEGIGLAWLRPALAAAALALVYPAYLGLFELPRERERATREIASAREHAQPPLPAPTAPWSGAAKALVLAGPERGASTLPRVRLEPGQPYLPVMLSTEPGVLPPSGPVQVTVTRSNGEVAWRASAEIGVLWDVRNRVASVLVPGAALPPGDYELAVRAPGRPTPLFARRFQVEPPR